MHRSLKSQAVSAFVACLMLFLFSAQALSGTITSWGWDGYNQVTNTPLDTNFTAIAGGGYHSLALTSDSVAVVPEPSSIAMFGIGALGLFGYSRRRRQTSAAA